MPRTRLHCCRARGERAAGFCAPPPPAPSLPGPLCPHGQPRYRCPLHRLGRLPSPPAPLSRTRDAQVRRARTWRRWFRQYAPAGSPRFRRPPPCPSVGPAAPPSLARPSARCCRRRLPETWFLRQWGGVRPLPAPSILPRSALARCGPSGDFVPPGQLCHSGDVGALWRIDSPAHSVAGPP